jgi:hypothetical protein
MSIEDKMKDPKDAASKIVKHLLDMIQEGMPATVMVRKLTEDHNIDPKTSAQMVATAMAKLKRYFASRGRPLTKPGGRIIRPAGYQD